MGHFGFGTQRGVHVFQLPMRVDPADILLRYVRERHQRVSLRSLAGVDPDLPIAPRRAPVAAWDAPADDPRAGEWERLCAACRGVDQRVLLALTAREFGYDGETVRWSQPARYTSMAEWREDAIARGVSEDALGGELVAERVAQRPTWAAIARALGVSAKELRGLVRAAHDVVRENLLHRVA